MFRNKKSRITSNLRSKFSFRSRRLRYETMEGRLMLSATGFAGNECAPELNDTALDAIVPSASVSPETAIAFSFSAADVVSDDGAGATAPADILFILDPDLGTRINGATPAGAALSLNDQGTTDVSDDLWEFSWTPDASQIGTFRLFILATDDGGIDNIPLSDVYAFDLTIDSNPKVDLNGDNVDGIDFGPVTFTEGDSSVAIVDSDNLTIPFVSGNMVSSATVKIDSPQAGEVESLGITGGALEVDTSTPGQLVITVVGGGLAEKSVFETALRTLTYTNSSDDPIATQTISVTINDGTSESDAAVARVSLTGTNDRPDLLQIDTPANAKVGETYVLDLVASDPDGGALLVFQIINDGSNGLLALPNAEILPNAGGLAVRNTIQVARDATDGLFHAQVHWTPTQEELEQQELSDDKTVLIRISVTDSVSSPDSEDYSIVIENENPVANNDPTAGADPFAVSEDAGATGGTTVGDILENDTDADGDTFEVHTVLAGGSTFGVGTPFTHPTSNAKILVSANGQVVYNPNDQFESLGAGETDTDTFQYTIIDVNGGVSGEATVTITINGENDAPLALDIDDLGADEEGDPVTGNFAGSDIDGTLASDLTYVITRDLAIEDEGSVTNNGDGSFTFDPGSDFQDLAEGATRPVTFDYSAMDQALTSLSDGTVTITVTGVNDAPVIDLSEETGVPSVLPTGNLQTGSNNIINLVIGLDSSDLNVSRLNLLDLPSFTQDPDGDDVTYDMELGNGTAFRGANEPELTNGILEWVPTSDDIGQGYVIQISGDDLPPGGNNAKPLNSFDIVIEVVQADPPQVVSVTPSIEVFSDSSVVTISFDEVMGDAAFDSDNYSFVAVDGSLAEEAVSILTATPSAGNDGVVLVLSDFTVNSIADPLAGGTKIRVTLNPSIVSFDGNALAGQRVFDIDLITAIP